MLVHRRVFIASLAASVGVLASHAAPPRRPFKAVALDAFTTFDPRPVVAACERICPGQGTVLANAWRTRQFEYTWLRTIVNRYADFATVTHDALVFAAASLRVVLSPQNREELVQAYFQLPAWPDSHSALEQLRRSGVRVVFLSNFTEEMLRASARSSGLQDVVDGYLSTDRVRAFKPDRRAYQMAPDVLELKREEIVFAAFAGWDAEGAKEFGLPTFWVNRMKSPGEELGVAADSSGTDLHDLLKYVKGA